MADVISLRLMLLPIVYFIILWLMLLPLFVADVITTSCPVGGCYIGLI